MDKMAVIEFSGVTELWRLSFWRRLDYLCDHHGARLLLTLPFMPDSFDAAVVVNVPVPVQFYGWCDG